MLLKSSIKPNQKKLDPPTQGANLFRVVGVNPLLFIELPFNYNWNVLILDICYFCIIPETQCAKETHYWWDGWQNPVGQGDPLLVGWVTKPSGPRRPIIGGMGDKTQWAKETHYWWDGWQNPVGQGDPLLVGWVTKHSGARRPIIGGMGDITSIIRSYNSICKDVVQQENKKRTSEMCLI